MAIPVQEYCLHCSRPSLLLDKEIVQGKSTFSIYHNFLIKRVILSAIRLSSVINQQKRCSASIPVAFTRSQKLI